MRRFLSGTHFTFADWQVNLHTNGKAVQPDWKRILAEIWHKLENPERILKQDHRSFVGVFTVNKEQYIVKKFTLQNTWLWFQITSVFSPTLGEITCRNGLNLNDEGFLTPRPAMLMQLIKHGMVKDCWLVYRFLAGDPLTPADDREIVDYIRRLHQAGWIHRDPHPANFIKTGQGIAMLDPIRAKRSRNRYLRAYDVVLMSHDVPDAPVLYGRQDLGYWYRLAQVGHNIIRLYRWLKHKSRALLRIRNNS